MALENIIFPLGMAVRYDSRTKNLEEYDLVACELIHLLLPLSDPLKTSKR